jgi:WD40 repeat protein
MGNCSNASNDQRREREKQKLKNTKNALNSTNNEEDKENFNQNSTNPNQNISNIKSSYKKEEKAESNYYLICPDCLMRSPHIEKLYYDENGKEFVVKYTCICNNLMSTKESPFLKLLTNEEPQNMCTLHQEKKLIAFCNTCKRAICSICKEELHTDHDIDMDIIRKSISKENADNMLKIIKEKEQQFNEDISKNEEKMENGINNMIQKLNEEKIKYKKQLENYKDNNMKTFDFLKNLYSRYINNFDENKNVQNLNNSQENNINNYLNNNDIMLTNHINNFVIKDSNALQLDTNIDEIINQYDEEKKELKLNYEFGFSNKDKSLFKSLQKIEQSIDDQKNNQNNSNESIDINFINTKTIEGHKEKIVCLIELSSGRLASGSYDKTIRIWNADYEKEDIKIKEKSRIFCLLEFEENKILCGTSDNVINLYEINSLNYDFIYSFIGHTLWVNCLTKINNNYFASASNDTKIKIWDYFNKKCIKTLEGHEDCILSLITLKQSNYLCSGAADLTIRIWDWEKSKCLYILKGHEKWVKCVIELDNGIIVSGSDDKSIKLWKDNINIKTLQGHNNSIRGLCQINENFFASGSFDFSIKIWEINTWECIQTLVGHDSNIICVISLNNNINKSKNLGDNYIKRPLLIASCSNDKTIKIWEEENN